jgi:hypothetical protein
MTFSPADCALGEVALSDRHPWQLRAANQSALPLRLESLDLPPGSELATPLPLDFAPGEQKTLAVRLNLAGAPVEPFSHARFAATLGARVSNRFGAIEQQPFSLTFSTSQPLRVEPARLEFVWNEDEQPAAAALVVSARQTLKSCDIECEQGDFEISAMPQADLAVGAPFVVRRAAMPLGTHQDRLLRIAAVDVSGQSLVAYVPCHCEYRRDLVVLPARIELYPVCQGTPTETEAMISSRGGRPLTLIAWRAEFEHLEIEPIEGGGTSTLWLRIRQRAVSAGFQAERVWCVIADGRREPVELTLVVICHGSS